MVNTATIDYDDATYEGTEVGFRLARNGDVVKPELGETDEKSKKEEKIAKQKRRRWMIRRIRRDFQHVG